MGSSDARVPDASRPGAYGPGAYEPGAYEPGAMVNLLLYGSLEARQRLASQLMDGGDRLAWQLLVATVAAREPWLLRARCLEVIGLMAGGAGQQEAEEIMELLGAAHRTAAPPSGEAGPPISG